MARVRMRRATVRDLELLVQHRRAMWVDIGRHSKRALDAADEVYRRWARARLRSGELVGFVVDGGNGQAVASGCAWVMDSQPRPGWSGTKQAYLLSMYTAPRDRGKGHATRIVRAAVRWARSQGLDRMSLHAADAGYGIYERAGFERTHEMRLLIRHVPHRAKQTR